MEIKLLWSLPAESGYVARIEVMAWEGPSEVDSAADRSRVLPLSWRFGFIDITVPCD